MDNNHKRISKRQLEDTILRLSDKDIAILSTIYMCHFITTRQVKRLFFNKSSTDSAAMRAASRNVTKLKGFGLIMHLKRRIGGVRAGSASYVWMITSAGLKVLNNNDTSMRKRTFEPSPAFLMHILAVSEIYVQLNELCRENKIQLKTIKFEPDCWRSYTNRELTAKILKPDLYGVIQNQEYEDHYFFEIDRATQAPMRVVRKCKQYISYYHASEEQKRSGVFPLVVWIVPDNKRKESLLTHLGELKEFIQLYIFITIDQFRSLILNGADVFRQELSYD